MRISRKLKKHLIQKPEIRPHVIKSLIAFDQEINQHQNILWNHPSRNRKTSKTLDLLRLLIQKMNANNHFMIQQDQVIKQLQLNQISYNFNFSALYQLKIIKINWNLFKSNHVVKGIINTRKVF